MKIRGFLPIKSSNLAEKLDEDNILPFVKPDLPPRGGKSSGGGEFNGKDWLSPMKAGTIFLARPFEDKGPHLIQYTVMVHTKKATCLFKQDQGSVVWRDPKRFCQVMELVEELKKEEDNGNGKADRPD